MKITTSRNSRFSFRFLVPALWIGSTLALCAVFALFATPRVDAQVVNESRRYSLIIQKAFDFIQNHYVDESDAKKLYEGAMKGMFEALGDPYTVFLSESDMTDLSDTTQGNFGGVGLYITKPTEPSKSGRPLWVEVASPIEDTPGWRAGISPGDFIVEIDGESTAKLTMDEVLARLRGVPGTEVTILIRRGERLEFPVKLVRAIIEVPTVKSAMIGDDIGYLRITTFTPMTAERTEETILSFARKGYRALIIDLRNNYGGLLDAAIDVSDYLLQGGVVVATKSRIPQENFVHKAREKTIVPQSIPVIVLINRGSASASEIVAGALKDRGRAYLIGEKSYGKGSVQQVIYPIDPSVKSGFKITTSRYYTPSDVNIDKIGIPPDLEVGFPVLTDAEADSLNKLISDDLIPLFVKDNPNPTPARIEAFIQELTTTYKLSASLLKRLVRDERNRTVIAPVFDLEYDIQLKAAVDLLRSDRYPELMRNVKTLKELQAEAALKEDAEKSTEAGTLIPDPSK